MTLLFAVLATLVIGQPAAAQTSDSAADATAFLSGIYKAYTASDSSGLDLNTANVKRVFSPPLAKLILADQRNTKGEVGRLDGDPFIDGQDWEIKDLKISAEPGEKNHAAGVVTFRNFDEPKTVRIDLLRGIKGWQVDDIHWDQGDSLRGILTAKP